MLCDQQKMWNNFGEYEKKVFARLFARYIFSALSRNCDKRAGMSHSLRKQWIKEVYKQNLFYELIPFASSENIFMKFLIFVLKKKNISFSLIIGRCIFITQNKMKSIFVKLKQKR